MEANSDSGGFHREAAGQAAQYGLNRVALGFLAMEIYLPLQLHRFKLHTTLCRRKVLISEFLMDSVHHNMFKIPALTICSDLTIVSHHSGKGSCCKSNYTLSFMSYQCCPCSSLLAEPRNEHS